MEIIELSGYTETDKVHIAQGYLVPRQAKANGLLLDEVLVTEPALREITRRYTREAGVRNLERQIGKVLRKVAVSIAEGKTGTVTIDQEHVRGYLGAPRFTFEAAERTELPGVATGLAYTPFGGDVLFVEASTAKGSGKFTLTGQLGDVMRESAEAALSYIRSHAEALGIDPEMFADHDIHVHVPSGATPKDGPSAGVTIATALASLVTRRPVRSEVGMTGEITLRGKVLPIGGLKEKALAAHRAGLTTVIIPQRNEPDLDEVPDEVRRSVKFVLADQIDEVLAAALDERSVPKRALRDGAVESVADRLGMPAAD
jgi:ATP-dependent Lon protease